MKIEALLSIKLWIPTILLQIEPISLITRYLFADIIYLKWLFIVMTLDLITGVMKAIKLTGLKSVTSRGFRDTLYKFLIYACTLIVTHVLLNYEVAGQRVNGDLGWISKIVHNFIILIEIKSVYENIIQINPALDFFSKVIKKISDLFPQNRTQNQKEL